MASYIKRLREQGEADPKASNDIDNSLAFDTVNQTDLVQGETLGGVTLNRHSKEEPLLFHKKSKDTEQINKAFGWNNKEISKNINIPRNGRHEMNVHEQALLESKIRSYKPISNMLRLQWDDLKLFD